MPPKKNETPSAAAAREARELRDVPPDREVKVPPPPDEPAARTPKKPTAPLRRPPFKKQIEDAFVTISVAVAATGDLHCATIIAANAEPMALAWADLAKVNPRVQAVIERMLTGSAWGGVIFATAACAIPIAVHHKMLPEKFPLPMGFGIDQSPEVQEEDKRRGTDGKPKT